MTERAPETAPVTRVPGPRRRVFMERSAGERARIFWWSLVRSVGFRWSPAAWHGWRAFLLRAFGADVHPAARIAPSARIDHPWNLRLGRSSAVAERAILNCLGRIEIGAGARIDRDAHLCAASHDYRRADMPILRRPITVGAGAWIGEDAFVGPGVTVGEGCVLTPRSSAFRDLPAGAVCSGEPARPDPPEASAPLAGGASRPYRHGPWDCGSTTR